MYCCDVRKFPVMVLEPAYTIVLFVAMNSFRRTPAHAYPQKEGDKELKRRPLRNDWFAFSRIVKRLAWNH